MRVWLIWTEQGEYEAYSRDLRGIFSTETLARAHCEQLGRGEVEEQDILEILPHMITVHHWSDHVAVDGSLSPEQLGRRRSSWETWCNEWQPKPGEIRRWDGRSPALYVEVEGIDLDAVKEEHARLVVEARMRIKAEVAAS